MKELYLGNEAVARGLYEAGVTVVSSYPGTPSTEITEYAAEYDEIFAEWSPNEKVSLEVAIGASYGGARAFSGMKHVGLNVAADPLFTVSYTGVNGGLCIAVADDPGMHSSQNEQDSRHFAIASKVPMLEPCDSQESKDYTKLCFELSEKFDTPFILRLSTRVSHSRSLVDLSDRVPRQLIEWKKNPQKYVMVPLNARGRHLVVEERMKELSKYAEESGINQIIEGDRKIGVIAAGISYIYAREALGDNASYLKLGMVNPLPVELIKKFAGMVDTLYVVEDLDPVIETHCKANGIHVIGKEIFPLIGEFSQALVEEKILGIKRERVDFGEPLPNRPPVMCSGCSHRGLFAALKKLKLDYISGDIGCYSLAFQPPLSAMDSLVCMGKAVSGLHGFNLAVGKEKSKKNVAVLGDSTFIHSGVTGLIDIAYNGTNSKVIVADNSTTGMTGHQENPTTGRTLKNQPSLPIDLEALAKSIGIKNVAVVDPYDLSTTYEVIKEELEKDEPGLIIARKPCALLKSSKAAPALYIDIETCRRCGACLAIGCPSISRGEDGVISIDKNLCFGCGICVHTCKFGAIKSTKTGGV